MTTSEKKLLTIPIASLLVFIICTFYPLIYKYLPILGKVKAVLIAGIVMLTSYMMTRDNYTNTHAHKNPIFIVLIGYVLSVILSIFVSVDRGLSLQLSIINLKIFIIAAILVKIIDNEKRLNLLIGAFSICAVGMALYSILNYVTGNTSSHSGYTSSRAISIGIFGDPNDLALLFNVALPYLLFFWIKAKNKLLPLLGVLAIIMAIVLTFSRGGFLGLCTVGIGFYLFYAKNQKKYLLCLFVISMLFFALAPPEYSERLSTIISWEVDQETGETGTRIDAWRAVFFENLKQHPFFGRGAGCSIYIAADAMGDWHLIHNSFIQVFSELGLFGLSFYLFIFYLPYRQYRRALRLKNREIALHLIRFRMILVSFATYAIIVIFLPQAYSPILYILAGIAIVQSHLIFYGKTSNPPHQPTKDTQNQGAD